MAGGDQRAFEFVKVNEREQEPRTRGITEIRGPYYTPVGRARDGTFFPPGGRKAL